MDPVNQPSPYFIRRAAPAPGQTIDVTDYSVVEDSVHPLRDYWLIAKRHRWLILTCALVSFIGAALYAFTRTPLYTSEATLLIERKAPQILKLQDARGEAADFNDYNNEFYKTQYEILKSRALAERVVRDQGLENHPLFGGGKAAAAAKQGLVSGIWHELKKTAQGVMSGKPDAPAPNTQNPTPNTQDPIPVATRLAGQYLSMLEVRPVAGTSLVTIKITTPEAALSARLADAHASSYVRYGIDLRSETNSDAGDFLQQKLVELKERIEQSEAALNSYRKEKGIISVDDKSNIIIERLLDLNKGLTAAEGERIGWEAQVRAARGRNAEEIPAVRNSTAISALKAELAKTEAEYASLAKEFKAGYPALDNLRARIDETRRRMAAEIEREVKSIEAGYAAAINKESQFRAAMDEQKRATLSLKDSAVQYAILAREVDTNKQLYDGVLSRLKEIGVAGEVRSSNIHVMGKALPPGGPSYPDKRRLMILGLLLGLAAGAGLAFLLEQLDNTLKTPEEAERYLRLASLGMIPEFAAVNGKGSGFIAKLLQSAHAELPAATRKKTADDSAGAVLLDHNPRSVVAEAYRSFRSALLLSQAGGPPHTMLVTSAGRGDGKTTTLVNTAIVFAQLGIRVLIVDADFRRPHCHMLLRTENKAGLSDLLAGQLDLDEAIRATPAENLFVISAGAVPPNPAELLGSSKMHELLEQLRQRFEFVFIDSSPVLAVTDSVFISTMVDGTLLVVNSRTPKPLVKKARARLALAQSKVLGMLLNRVDIHSNEYGGYYQQYYSYYRDDETPALTNGTPKFVANGNGTPTHVSKSHSADAPGPMPQEKHENGRASKSFDDLGAKHSEAINQISPLAVGEEAVVGLGELPDASPEKRLQDVSKRLSRGIADQKIEDEVSEIVKITAENGAKPTQELPSLASPAAIMKAVLPAAVDSHQTIAKPRIREPDKGLPAEFLDVVGDKLLKAMGPMAPIVLREHVRAVGGAAGSFPKAKLAELAKELGQEISDDHHRQVFEKELSEDIQKLGLQAYGRISDEKNGTTKAATKKEVDDTQEFLSIISANLSDAIGPIAPLVLRERIVALGESAEEFPRARIEELIVDLSIEISYEPIRRQFQKEMARQIQKLKKHGAWG
jgi:succinoglycan biosynthesis transport protein ExoP